MHIERSAINASPKLMQWMKKKKIPHTGDPTLSTDADVRTDTNFKRLRYLSKKNIFIYNFFL